MKKVIFKGAATALITPFKDGKVDFDAYGKIIDFQIEQGIDAIVSCGTTGEASTLTDAEQIATIQFAVQRAAGRVPVIAGTGSNDSAHGLILSKDAANVGADALLITTPYYNKTSQRGLIKLYTDLADSVDKPIILYNVPSRTGLNIEPATYAALAEHPNIVGIKEAGGNFSKIAETMHLVGDKLTLYSGNDDQIAPMLGIGGMGVISVLSNILPAETSRMCHEFFNGNTAECAKMQLDYLPLINALFSDVNPIPVKEAMALLGGCTRELRAPLLGMEDSALKKLKAVLDQYGIEKVC